MSKNTNKVAFYAKNGRGTLDELILDLFEREFQYNKNLDERDLWQRHGGSGREFQLEPAELEELCYTVEGTFLRGAYSSCFPDEEGAAPRVRRRSRGEPVPKELVWRALKWEYGEEELCDLCSCEKHWYEKGNYYDFELILDKIHAFMAGERSVGYFTAWLILLMRALEECSDGKKRRRKKIYSEIADCLDGAAFMSLDISDEQKRVECLELIALLKHYDHQLSNLDVKKDVPFTKNGVITYVVFVAYICGKDDTELYKVCVVDEDAKTVNYLYISDLVYREEINYTFVTGAEFDCLTSTYYRYTFDGTMREDYAMTKPNR